MTNHSITDRIAHVTKCKERVERAKADIARLEAELKDARRELRTAQQERPRGMFVESSLHRMKELADAGSQVVRLQGMAGYGDYPGVVLKVTRTRVKVLTERGELEFNRNPTKWDVAGKGRGDARHFTLCDVESVS